MIDSLIAFWKGSNLRLPNTRDPSERVDGQRALRLSDGVHLSRKHDEKKLYMRGKESDILVRM